MKGNNTLTLNHATVIEALQEYFGRRTIEEGRFKIAGISTSDTLIEVFTMTDE